MAALSDDDELCLITADSDICLCCLQQDDEASTGVFIVERLADNTVLYIAVNFAGMYTKYLTDRGQRKAFLETHRSMETRCRTQKENDRQEKLLLSGEPLSCAPARAVVIQRGNSRLNTHVWDTAPCNVRGAYCFHHRSGDLHNHRYDGGSTHP